MSFELFDVSGEGVHVCQVCGEVFRVDDSGSGARSWLGGHIVEDCPRFDEVVYSFLSAPFGLLVPDVGSDFVYSCQTEGLMCTNRSVRGHYVPLSNPSVFESEVDKGDVYEFPNQQEGIDGLVSLLSELCEANYQNNVGEGGYDTGVIWSYIDGELPFTYEECECPDGYWGTAEGWKWVRVTGEVEESVMFHSMSKLVGERVVLVYPNSD